ARNPWAFGLAIALAAFWNDMTMGSAWASCIDIGKRYSGIVAGCMNTIGNLGGFVANKATAQLLDLYGVSSARRAVAAAQEAAAAVPGGAGAAQQLADAQEQLKSALQRGWEVNFIIFTAVYVAATLLWLRFDSTRPVVPDET